MHAPPAISAQATPCASASPAGAERQRSSRAATSVASSSGSTGAEAAGVGPPFGSERRRSVSLL
jgi:hypothetical protein